MYLFVGMPDEAELFPCVFMQVLPEYPSGYVMVLVWLFRSLVSVSPLVVPPMVMPDASQLAFVVPEAPEAEQT
jgi:hypothetical protein